MTPEGTFRQSAKNARSRGRNAEDSSRLHTRDLERMVRTGKDARAMLKLGQERQREREQVKADAALRLATVKAAGEGTAAEDRVASVSSIKSACLP